MYFAPNTDQGFIDAITTAALYDTVNRPIGHFDQSGGPPEVALDAGIRLQAMDQAFQAAAAMGVTVYCASGDNGASDFPARAPLSRANLGRTHIHDFPAVRARMWSAVAGTPRISVANNAITSEVVWNDPGGARRVADSAPSSLDRQPAAANKEVQGGWRWRHLTLPGRRQSGKRRLHGTRRRPERGYAHGGTSAVSPLWARR